MGPGCLANPPRHSSRPVAGAALGPRPFCNCACTPAALGRAWRRGVVLQRRVNVLHRGRALAVQRLLHPVGVASQPVLLARRRHRARWHHRLRRPHLEPGRALSQPVDRRALLLQSLLHGRPRDSRPDRVAVRLALGDEPVEPRLLLVGVFGPGHRLEVALPRLMLRGRRPVRHRLQVLGCQGRRLADALELLPHLALPLRARLGLVLRQLTLLLCRHLRLGQLVGELLHLLLEAVPAGPAHLHAVQLDVHVLDCRRPHHRNQPPVAVDGVLVARQHRRRIELGEHLRRVDQIAGADDAARLVEAEHLVHGRD